MMNAHVSTLLEKEVSRKEFLGISALAIASIFGFGTILKMFTGKSLTTSGVQHANGGYGNSTYGGFHQ